MPNIKITVSYDGTNYYGFQEQRGAGFQTIQGVLEDRLSKLAGREIRVIGAGRTDAGVHARGQVVNFKENSCEIPPDRVAYALDSLLPADITAVESVLVEDTFHSRFSAVAKTYRYVISNEKKRSPFLRLYSHHVSRMLDVEAMQIGARHLVGRHDFSAFRAQGTPVKTTVRTLHEVQVIREDSMVYIDMRGQGFLYRMARMIAGTLIRAGLGKIDPGDVVTILESRNSMKGGPTAPAQGLFLEKIEYP